MEVAEEAHHHTRLCDYCDSSVALVYCKADSAKLCLACDKQVHVTNQLFAKHFRSLLCDSCDDSPASLFCDSEISVLCQNCDWERRNCSSSVRSRRPVEGFSGCPSVTELLALVGLDDLSDKPFFPDSESSELLLWETPEIVTISDLIASSGSGHNFRATDVPPLPKNRNATCGKHKEEMIRQLREISRSEPNCLKHEDLDVGFQFLAPEIDDDLFSGCEVNGLKWFEEDIPNDYVPESDEKPDNVKRGCPQSTAINSLERNSALSRYKEKKKSRRYEKHIRYESRKVRAESRTRIRGRFAKADP